MPIGLRHDRRVAEKLYAPERSAAFSDAVVGIAMTALVLPLLDVDVTSDTTFGELWAQYDGKFVAFLLSFFVVAIYWVQHHRFWSKLDRVDPALLWLNFAYLLGIVLIPFGAVLLYEPGEDAPILGMQIYAAINAFVVLSLAAMEFYASRQPHLSHSLPRQPWWWALRFTVVWLAVLALLIVEPTAGARLLPWAGLVMFVLGSGYLLRRFAPALTSRGSDGSDSPVAGDEHS